MLQKQPKHLFNLFFPSTCASCATSLLKGEEILCLSCQLDLPYTRMHDLPFNAMELRLFGRFRFEAATALFFFVKAGRVQRMIHELKYLGGQEIGHYLGRRLADALRDSERFAEVDIVVSVPLHPHKKKVRGYNQVEEIAIGMEERGYSLLSDALVRLHDNESQTRKTMAERWENVEHVFKLNHGDRLKGKKVLLLDDVLTTGATLEACARELLKVEGIKLYVATVACAEL